jgi:hypothetical protein
VPTPVELDAWLPRILGASESADSFLLAETVPEFGMLFDRGAERFVYTGCKVSRAVFSGAPGQLIDLHAGHHRQDGRWRGYGVAWHGSGHQYRTALRVQRLDVRPLG